MRINTKNQLTTSIRDEIQTIQEFLVQQEAPHSFETQKLKQNVDSLTILLPRMTDEITTLSAELEQKKILNKTLEDDAQFLTAEIKTLTKTLREKHKYLKKLENILTIIKDPQTQEKIKIFEQNYLEVPQLEESIQEKNSQLTELQNKLDTFVALKDELAHYINAIDDEKKTIAQLELDILQGESRLEEVTAIELPQNLEKCKLHLLNAMRLALTVKHQNLEPPHWEKILELLEQEDEGK